MTMAQLVSKYSNAVGRHGPDSQQARQLRAANAANTKFLAYADALDRIKRHLGGSGIENTMTPARFDLPPGCEVRGTLYLELADGLYGLGDVCEIELPTGYTIDVSYDPGSRVCPFQVSVYQGSFSDRFIVIDVATPDEAVKLVNKLAWFNRS